MIKTTTRGGIMNGECEGHYDDDATLTSGVGIGEPTFCDGSCNPQDEAERDWQAAERLSDKQPLTIYDLPIAKWALGGRDDEDYYLDRMEADAGTQ
jgi:hypothetical protein